MTDRAASWIQNFWLDATMPLIFILEKADELKVSAEVITVADNPFKQGFHKGHPHKQPRRGGNQYGSSGGSQGWQGHGTPKK